VRLSEACSLEGHLTGTLWDPVIEKARQVLECIVWDCGVGAKSEMVEA